ncbi:MAG: hypothetical protein KIT22_10885, partial [Verrucomicrobiae bacterium]|nr:hypothetical protein [Verrucomicrobiae bacterium]
VSREIRVTVADPAGSENAQDVTMPEPPTQASPESSLETSLAAPAAWSAWLWLGGVLVCLARVGWRRAMLAWIGWRAAAADAATIAAAAQTLPSLPLGRVRLLAWRPLRGPIAYGILRPTIAVPPDFSTRFEPAACSAMLAHELAHLAARDPLWLLISDLVCALWWWHPAVWWTRRRLRVCSEEAADGASALAPGGPGVLADCLVRLARERTPPEALHDMGVRGSGRATDLARRVEALLRTSAPWKPPGRWETGRSGVLALIAVLALWALPLPWASGAPTILAALAAAPEAPAAAVPSPAIRPSPSLATQVAVAQALAVQDAAVEVNPISPAAELPSERTNHPSTSAPSPSPVTPESQTPDGALANTIPETPEKLAAQTATSRHGEDSSGESLRTRTFVRLDPQRFVAAIRATEGVPVSADLQTQVWNFFRSCGLSLDPERPTGTPDQTKPAVYFLEAKGTLFVRASEAECEAASRIAGLLTYPGAANEPSEPVVTLTAYFAEMTVGGPEEIGLDWVFGQAPTNNPVVETIRLESGSGHTDRLRIVGQAATLTSSQFAALHNQLAQRTGLDLLATPKVSTVAGRSANVQIREVRKVVTRVTARVNDSMRAEGFDQVEKVEGTNNVGAMYWVEDIEVGPQLEVVPEVNGEGWQLQLTATLDEFLGYEDPGKLKAKFQVPGAKPLTAQVPLPLLRSREMTATARVESGGVVALRGPMVENRTIQKGGLFRRTVTNVVQKRLYVFVKAESGSTNAPASGAEANLPIKPVIVRIPPGSADYAVGQRTVADFELPGVLRSLALAHPGLRLIIGFDKGVEPARVARIHDVTREAGIRVATCCVP